jgi:molybdopterin-guanine dinucleotide biosynthesis protein A
MNPNAKISAGSVKPFAAALLAGGKSRRMGSDKALLPVESGGRFVPLWEKQWDLLKSLEPVELLFSGLKRRGLPVDLRFLADRWDAGPLGGIATCLDEIQVQWLLVVAIDMPKMTLICLAEILRAAIDSGTGIIPVLNDKFEPVIAIYPKAALQIAVEQIQQSNFKLQDFARELLAIGLIKAWNVPLQFAPCFKNWNQPE